MELEFGARSLVTKWKIDFKLILNNRPLSIIPIIQHFLSFVEISVLSTNFNIMVLDWLC